MCGSHVVELASVLAGRLSVARSVRGLSGVGVTSWCPLRARAAEICSLVAEISASFLFLALAESLIRSDRAQWVGSLCQVCVSSSVQLVGVDEVVMIASRGDMMMQLSHRWLTRKAPVGEVMSSIRAVGLQIVDWRPISG